MGSSTDIFDVISDSTELVTLGREVVEGDIKTIPSKTKCDTPPNTLCGSGNESDTLGDRHELKRTSVKGCSQSVGGGRLYIFGRGRRRPSVEGSREREILVLNCEADREVYEARRKL